MTGDQGEELSNQPKKGKEKKKKRNAFNEDDLLEEMAALQVESGGGQPTEETTDTPVPDPQPAGKQKTRGGKKGKKGWDEDELMAEVAAIESAGKGSGKKKEKETVENQKETEISMETNDTVPEQSQPTGKKGKKKKGKAKDWNEDELLEDMAALEEEKPLPSETKTQEVPKKEALDGQDDEEDSGPVMKTAAQKKAEKKEREKKKKEAQREEARRKKQKEQAKESEKSVDVNEDDEGAKHKEGEGEPQEDEGDEAEEESGKKKKKKKGKKGEEDEKKKKPGKGQLKLMQEALKKMKEEEERLKAEEEAKQKAAEEAENQRLEKIRLEKERKERQKQKKKERIEQMKLDGTYLTPKEKEKKRRAEEMLRAMKEQGLAIPTKGSEETRVLYGKRDRRKKKQDVQSSKENNNQEPVEEEKSEEQLTDSTSAENEKGEKEEEEKTDNEVKDSWDAEDDVADNWDEDSDEEKKEDEAEEEADKIPKANITIKSQEIKEDEEESEEESEEEEESSEEDEEEEESESDVDESDDEMSKEEKIRHRAMQRIEKRREEAEKRRSTDHLRSPVVCVLGHVDTGKTKILDKIRHSNVQDGEAGGITQQIGATMVPQQAIQDQTKMCREFVKEEMKIPGLLIIDTPGHESFSNLRSRGSSLCDIAILVVDIMHGLEPQTIESINLLKQRKTPFIVALNKIDRLFEWKTSPNTDVTNTIKKQKRNTRDEFEERTRNIITEFAEQGLNAALFNDNPDSKTYISLVPTSAHSGDGMGNLISLIVTLSQTLLAKRLAFSEMLQVTTLEVKSLPGLGTTIDVVLVNGTLKEGDTIVVAGQEGPIVSQVRGLLMPQPLKELRVKNQYVKHKEIKGAQGVKVLAKDLEKAMAGLPMLVAEHPDEIEIHKEEVSRLLKAALTSIKLTERGVYVQASTLGSLEALLEFLRTSKIPYSGINIGPVHKKDVMKASVMLEHDSQYAVILAFDIKVERDAQELADRENIKIFQADIIYHLFDRFMAYREELKKRNKEQYKHIAVFPCKLRVLPQHIFNARNPIVIGVSIEGGIVKQGTPIIVPSKENCEIGVISSLELNHKMVDTARKGQEVCVKIENVSGDAPKMYGRHFDHNDLLVSKISRESIDAVKTYFRDELEKPDWLVMIELKKMLGIL
ncbi:eukaryotic translation initiation factor 5B-like [Lytechinus pictus]|uniref:eukaryotic translation initiation factor 5B-like n=1 Tax=Lytechinus pictus TaxID=7653 RepID=UPI0030B9B273